MMQLTAKDILRNIIEGKRIDPQGNWDKLSYFLFESPTMKTGNNPAMPLSTGGGIDGNTLKDAARRNGISVEEQKARYKKEYWDKYGVGALPTLPSLVFGDLIFSKGATELANMLNNTSEYGNKARNIVKLDPKTEAALASLTADNMKKKLPRIWYDLTADEQKKLIQIAYQGQLAIANDPNYKSNPNFKNKNGWINRANGILNFAKEQEKKNGTTKLPEK